MYLQQEVMLRQSEKLATLGKLSAGMAHELNNPAAAAQRAAAQLAAAFSDLQRAYLKLGASNLTDSQLELLLALDVQVQEPARKPAYLDALTRSDREAAWEA
jgi:C4-dicarboxylate-specific signal transduction histidine kinase